jgi:hypothetical protein
LLSRVAGVSIPADTGDFRLISRRALNTHAKRCKCARSRYPSEQRRGDSSACRRTLCPQSGWCWCARLRPR